MTRINTQRMTAQMDGDFVVFLIGMRINKFWKIHKWLPVAMAMGPMLKELLSDPESGLLGLHTYFGFRNTMLVQYWRSFEQLEAYARARDKSHFSAWVKFNRTIGSSGNVGIWHETYKISAGEYETVYNNMPCYGLGTVGRVVPATGRLETAKGRVRGVKE